jgi:hypothetical protein
MKICKTCKEEFDEPFNNCAPCRKILALKAKEHRRIHGAKINAKRLIKRRSKAKPMSEYPPKTCLHCDRTFQPSKANWRVAKFCSPKCRSHARIGMDKIYRWEKRQLITCKECGKVAKPMKSDGVTCSTVCSVEQRRKQKMAHQTKATSKGGIHYERYRAYQNQYQRKYKKERYEADPNYAVSVRIRSSLRKSLKTVGIKKTNKTFALLGYTKHQLREHLESQFTDGMSWDRFNEIHIDHIRPIASFNYTTTECEDFKKCWALENLQPLWAADNISKGNKWDGEVNA